MKIFCLLLTLIFFCSSCAKNDIVSENADSTAVNKNETNESLPLLKIIVGDIGKADFIVLSCEDEHMIIDCGYKKSYDYVESVLNDLKITNLKYAVGTHPDKDHIGAMAKLIKNFSVGELYISPHNNGSGEYEKMVERAEEKNVPIHFAAVGDVLTLGRATLTTYSPDGGILSLKDDNESSVVQMLSYGDFKMLFMADGQLICESMLLSSGLDLSADVIKIAHHGSNKSSTENFLKAVGAKYAVISAGEDDGEVYPSDAVCEKIQDLGMEIYRTDRDGGIVLTTDGININFERGYAPK